MTNKNFTVEAETKPAPLTDDERKKMFKLIDRAQAGDTKALDEVRPWLDRTGVWKQLGDLSHRVQRSWLEAMTGSNKLMHEAFERRADELRRELLESGDSPLERLLVERIVATWLQVCHADLAYASHLNANRPTVAQGTYALKRQDAANARHLKAVRALATARRLLVPPIQLNIARQQIISQGPPSSTAEGSE